MGAWPSFVSVCVLSTRALASYIPDTDILKHQKVTKVPSFFKKLMISQKLSFKVFFWTLHMLAKIKILDYMQKNPE